MESERSPLKNPYTFMTERKSKLKKKYRLGFAILCVGFIGCFSVVGIRTLRNPQSLVPTEKASKENILNKQEINGQLVPEEDGYIVSTEIVTPAAVSTSSAVTDRDVAALAESTPDSTVTPKPREAVVELAKSYDGKIKYLWGGKATNRQILGKEEPLKLDCSGFVQFVFSRVKKRKIPELGSTISISGLQKVKKSELKLGDIGLKRGTGSLYFDADKHKYTEPQYAKKANKLKLKKLKLSIKKQNKKIKVLRKTKTQLIKQVEMLRDQEDGFQEIESSNEAIDQELTEHSESMENTETQDSGLASVKDCRERIQENSDKIKRISLKIKKHKKTIRLKKKQEKPYKKKIKEKIDHVGIYCGKDKKGREIWCHCSSSQKGVSYQRTKMFKYYYRYLK